MKYGRATAFLRARPSRGGSCPEDRTFLTRIPWEFFLAKLTPNPTMNPINKTGRQKNCPFCSEHQSMYRHNFYSFESVSTFGVSFTLSAMYSSLFLLEKKSAFSTASGPTLLSFLLNLLRLFLSSTSLFSSFSNPFDISPHLSLGVTSKNNITRIKRW